MTDELDDFITRQEPMSLTDGSVFFLGLKKLAAEALAEAAPAVAAEAPAEAPVEEAPAEAAEAGTELAAPDMALPAPDPVALMTNAAALAMKCQLGALYYSEMMQGPEAESVGSRLRNISWTMAEDARHLLRKVGVLTNGAPPPMPPVPSPEPTSDPKAALQAMLACHQQYALALQTLSQALGEDPMHHTVSHMILACQKDGDRLSQLAPAGKTKTSALAAAVQLVRKMAAAGPPEPSPEAVVVPPPGSEPIEQTAMREMQLQLQQSEEEKKFLTNAMQQAQQSATENQAAAENAQAEADLQAQQAEQAGAQAQQATAQAQEAMTTATQSEESAAAQADGKMRLSMRINQLRQQLADIVSQDPVAEEGMGFGEEAGAGSPTTAAQQEQSMEEEEAAVAEQAAQPGGGKAKQEAQQAQNAKAEAQEQQGEAVQAAAG